MRVVGTNVVVPVPHRIAAVQHRRHLVVLAQGSQLLVSSTSEAERSNLAATTVTGAARAVRTVATPPGSATSSTASPPAAGNRHNDAGGLSSSSVGRDATKRMSPSAVKAGDDSPLAPRVSLRAGRRPVGSTSQTALTNSVRLSLSSATVVTTRDPSGETARPESRGSAM